MRAFLFVALQGSAPALGSTRLLLDGVDEVLLGRGEGGAERQARRIVLRLPDPLMSSEHARLERRGRGFVLVDLGSKNGVFVNGAAQKEALLGDGDRLELGNTFFVFRRLLTPEPVGDVTLAAQGDDAAMVSVRPDLEACLTQLMRAAASPVPLVILGETGTGKELLARAAHRLSGRAGELVAVNCGAIAPALLESELFGHVKGAFSGAVADQPGLLRASHGGTLFLDEVGELPAAAQVALLRALQEGEVRPVGGVKAVQVDLRVVCATHRELPLLVAEQRFRADLLARLSGFALRVPPLRERREDLGTMVATILARAGADALGRRFSRSAARRLFAHDWPLNTRELLQCLTTALAIDGEQLELAGLRLGPLAVPPRSSLSPSREPPADARDEPPQKWLAPEDDARRAQLIELMTKHGGNVSAVARDLGKARVQVRRWLKRYRLT